MKELKQMIDFIKDVSCLIYGKEVFFYDSGGDEWYSRDHCRIVSFEEILYWLKDNIYPYFSEDTETYESCRKIDLNNDDNKLFKFIISVNNGDALILDFPKEIKDIMKDASCHQNPILNIPEENGIYECHAKFYFDSSSFASYLTEDDNYYQFKIISSELLYVFK